MAPLKKSKEINSLTDYPVTKRVGNLKAEDKVGPCQPPEAFKIRQSQGTLPAQLNSNFNAALYIGRRIDLCNY